MINPVNGAAGCLEKQTERAGEVFLFLFTGARAVRSIIMSRQSIFKNNTEHDNNRRDAR